MARYDAIGRGYDATRRADPRIVARLHRLLAPREGGRYLDVACGTGNYTIALATAGLSMTGIDVSAVMLDAARTKAPAVDWRLCDVERLPFVAGTFSGALCTLAVHHMRAPAAVFAEVHRVIGTGRLVIFTATPGQMRGYWLNHYFPRALARSIERMPSLERLSDALDAAGFCDIETETFDVPEDFIDLFLYSGKHRPAIYFDPRVRAGISTFAADADEGEVARGLGRLEADIAFGDFRRIAAQYDGDAGDYLFVTARK